MNLFVFCNMIFVSIKKNLSIFFSYISFLAVTINLFSDYYFNLGRPSPPTHPATIQRSMFFPSEDADCCTIDVYSLHTSLHLINIHIYIGLSRGEERMVLLNFPPIHHFDKIM